MLWYQVARDGRSIDQDTSYCSFARLSREVRWKPVDVRNCRRAQLFRTFETIFVSQEKIAIFNDFYPLINDFVVFRFSNLSFLQTKSLFLPARCTIIQSAGIAIVILSVCLSVCYTRDPWLNRLAFSENSITTNYPRDMAHCTTLLIDLTLWGISNMCKSGIWGTKPAIYLKRSSLELATTECIYKRYAVHRLVTHLLT